MFYVPFPGTPGKIPGNSGSTELRKEFGTTLQVTDEVPEEPKPWSDTFRVELSCASYFYIILYHKFYLEYRDRQT